MCIRDRGGHAVSDDGIAWEKLPGPIMEPSSGWLAQHVAPLSWHKQDGKYYILVQGFDGRSWSVGYYVSTDLTHFEPESAPILRGEPGTWYSSGIEGADIYEDDGKTWLFFLGSSVENDVRGGLRYRVGVAAISSS
jgi:sucrose-6-phosphate hydrolase SacC (GH32 family)